MKKYFVTGVVILLPLAVTIAIIAFLVNLLTDPFLELSKAILSYFNIGENGFLFFSGDQLRRFASKLVILLILFFFTVFLGFIARWFFIHKLIQLWDYVIHRIPLVSTIYKTCQDVINTIFASKTNSFKQVVLVPFPSPETRSIGLVTRDNVPFPDSNTGNLVTVFVPTTPNPTSGFLMLFEEKDLTYLDMKVEEAFKYVISCGVIPTPFNAVSKTKSLEANQNQLTGLEDS
jgi:uncharacterized membrane protein